MNNDFKFSLNDRDHIIKHWVLNSDNNFIVLLSHTPEWANSKTLTARVTVNGVELPFDGLEKFLKRTYKKAMKEAEERFKDLDAEVQRRVEERVNNEARVILDRFEDLRCALENAGDAIVPYWYEKDNSGET